MNETERRRRQDKFVIGLIGLLALLAGISILARQALGADAPDKTRAGLPRSGGAEMVVTTTASAYGPGLYGNSLACGGRLNPSTRAVAHRYYACGKRLRVCYRARCQSVRVRDRGPFVAGRGLDLTEAVARRFGFRSAMHWGVRKVRYTIR